MTLLPRRQQHLIQKMLHQIGAYFPFLGGAVGVLLADAPEPEGAAILHGIERQRAEADDQNVLVGPMVFCAATPPAALRGGEMRCVSRTTCRSGSSPAAWV